MSTKEDDIERLLTGLDGGPPRPRAGLSEQEKDALVARIGPLLVRDIANAAHAYPVRRIPFLFSSVDTQAVVDILANDMSGAVERALAARPRKKKSG